MQDFARPAGGLEGRDGHAHDAELDSSSCFHHHPHPALRPLRNLDILPASITPPPFRYPSAGCLLLAILLVFENPVIYEENHVEIKWLDGHRIRRVERLIMVRFFPASG